MIQEWLEGKEEQYSGPWSGRPTSLMPTWGVGKHIATIRKIVGETTSPGSARLWLEQKLRLQMFLFRTNLETRWARWRLTGERGLIRGWTVSGESSCKRRKTEVHMDLGYIWEAGTLGILKWWKKDCSHMEVALPRLENSVEAPLLLQSSTGLRQRQRRVDFIHEK